MTLTAPGKRRTQRAPETGYTRPAIGVMGVGLAPPAGEPPARAERRGGLAGTSRLGAALILIVALLLQRTVLSLVPWGPADLVTVVVAVLGIYAGPAAGCISGFSVGLCADVVSDHALGRLAAVLCIVGYLGGMLPSRGPHRRAIAWVTIGAASVLTPLLFALTGAFVGDDRAAGMLLVTRCLAGLCYGLLLAPLVYPLTHRLLAPRRRRRGHSGRRHRRAWL